jgi:cytoskeletal protein CcmA (bactofilin family)
VKIGTTAVPTKNDFVCYECGYAFSISGKVRTLYCAKCRTILNQTDYVIDKPHDVSIVTAGTVTIAPRGQWTGGSIHARDVIVEGRHEDGSIKAFRRLVVGPGAVLQLEKIEAEDLVVRADVELSSAKPLRFRDVELHGTLLASLEGSGLVTIHPGGCLVGSLTTRHLKVIEGGGLRARVNTGGAPNGPLSA